MEAAGNLIDAIAQRVRDPQNTAISRAEILTLLNRTQAAYNAATKLVVESVDVTLEAYSPFIVLTDLVPTAVRVVSVAEGNRYLWFIPYSDLRGANHSWLRATATRPEEWCMAGREILVLRPTPVADATITINYVVHTADLVAETDTTVIPDDEQSGLLDLLEALVTTKMRNYELAASAGKRIAKRMGIKQASGQA